MSRDQRTADNWALLYARELAIKYRAPLAVVFCLVPSFLGAAARQYGFMLKGLAGVEAALEENGIRFFLLSGEPGDIIPGFVKKNRVAALVTDFDPLRIKRVWKDMVSAGIGIPFYEVDAHNIVPCRIASEKQEYGAYTIRPKINRLKNEFLTGFPQLGKHPYVWQGRPASSDWDAALRRLGPDGSVPETGSPAPGEAEAAAALRAFVKTRLDRYPANRNDPNRNGQSGLSPYLHFGQLSPQHTALEVMKSHAGEDAKSAFLEELIVRRELSDNFCMYNPEYDSMEGIPGWARDTLDAHRKDHREYIYTRDAFESAATHDPLWNAAQTEMVVTGRMHGYMRMYWAKKILEWSSSPEDAFATAIYLNDRYQLDGRDPNGYAGIAWSIGGVHDRAWGERPVFGKVRYMSYNGCRSKFDVQGYIRRVEGLQ